MALALVSGQPHTEIVTPTFGTPFVWSWYELNLDTNGTSHNAVVYVDSEMLQQSAGEQKWVRFDVLIVNGSLPGDSAGFPGPVSFGDPQCWADEECPNGYALHYEDVPRVTASFGYNQTAPGGIVEPAPTSVVIGVRPSPASQQLMSSTTSFTVTAIALPRELSDGDVIESSLAPCEGTDEGGPETCQQYFTVHVGEYDVLQLVLERAGDNLTFADGSSNGGRGLVGAMYVGSPATLANPPPSAYDRMRRITNQTVAVNAEYFCTLGGEAGTYTVAVVAGSSADGGFGPELLTSAAEQSIDAGVARQGRGRFTLRVRHASFDDGLVASPSVLPGCVGYGQTRNYSLATSGMGSANLHVELAGGNVSYVRIKCAGCDWFTAAPPITALSASPCAMRASTTWHIEVHLDEEVPATLNGLAPTEFVLYAELQNGTASPDGRVSTRQDGGAGYVCCGAVKSFVMPDVPQTHAMAVQLNVTKGAVRVAFLKHDTCANSALDISGSVCSAPGCEIAWLTVYDEFYGNMIHTSSAYLAVRFGPSAWEYNRLTTGRRAGDWYLSIASLPNIAAEFEVHTMLLEPPKEPERFRCNRWSGYCPKDHYHSGLVPVPRVEPSQPILLPAVFTSHAQHSGRLMPSSTEAVVVLVLVLFQLVVV